MRHLIALAPLALALALSGSARADPQSDRALRALQGSDSVKVRSQAALVLGQSQAPEAGPALRRAASSDPAPAVRIAAVSALARVGGAEAREALEGVRRDDRDPDVRGAAAAALGELAAVRPAPPAARGGPAVSLEETVGAGGSAADRVALRDALGRRLREAGFQLQGMGGLRLKPSIVHLDVQRVGEKTVVAIRAELVAVETGGRMAAMLEGSARLSATGAVEERELSAISGRAADAVAKVLVDDLAARLAER